jgi:hypothetical protein
MGFELDCARVIAGMAIGLAASPLRSRRRVVLDIVSFPF